MNVVVAGCCVVVVVAGCCLGVADVASWLVAVDGAGDWLLVAVCLMLSRSSIM